METIERENFEGLLAYINIIFPKKCCVFIQYGNTPLHEASRTNHVAAVEVLLKNGAEINQTTDVN